jgi:hypothetical protein
MTDNRLAKMISTRIEPDNIASIDKLARAQNISRSDWIRRAILAQLVLDLVELKESDVPRETTSPQPVPEIEPHIEIPTVGDAQWTHHIDCVKSIDHEGPCIDVPA